MSQPQLLLVVLTSLLLSACELKNNSTGVKIVVIGDSISTGYNVTESWPSRLQKSLNVPVNNHSVNGEQTAYGLEHIGPLLKQ